MDNYSIKKSLLSKSQQKIFLVIFEIMLFIFALLFLMPVFLAFINSFKTNSEIQINVASLPKMSVKIPKKVKKTPFEVSIINRLFSEEDKNRISSLYDYTDSVYILRGGLNSRLKAIENKYNIKFDKRINGTIMDSSIYDVVDNDERSVIDSSYKLKEGFYTLKKGLKFSKNEEKEITAILRKTGSFSTLTESFKRNYTRAWTETKFLKFLIYDRKINLFGFSVGTIKLPEIHGVFMNTLIITLFSTTGIILVSSMAAYAMVRTRGKASWVIFLLFTFAMVVPFQAIMFPLVKTADAFHLLSTFHGIIIIYMGVGCPMAIFMYHGFIKGVPLELEESASIDGAGKFRTFFQIVFPLLTPITATIIILDVLWIWNDFLLPLILLKDKDVITIQLAQYFTRGAYNRDFGLELASLVLASAPVIIFYLFMQKFIIKGITAGAVKG